MTSGISSELLTDIYSRQYKLQCYMTQKRGLCMPPLADADHITHEHVLAAIYFSSCINIEWRELGDAYLDYVGAEDPSVVQHLRLVALEELIDIFHFVLSTFIFLGLKQDQMSRLIHLKIGGLNSLAEYAGDMALALSAVLQKAPYKTWKDQDNVRVLDPEYQEFLFGKFLICYNDILDFAEYCLHSNYEEFVDLYLKKNDLNFKRQEDKSLGYIRE